MPKQNSRDQTWPALQLREWIDTRDTLHMWLQIVGKIRLAQSPPINHSWHTTLYVTSHGLTTSPIPHGERTFQIDLDLVSHRVIVTCSDGRAGGFALQPMSVGAFYQRTIEELQRFELRVHIAGSPNEVVEAIPFRKDDTHHSYDGDAVNRFWRMLVQADRVLKQFRSRFIGKCSPVHLFWGGMDLAVTRFSGRRAPEHPGGIPNLPDRVTREAYSHEVSSCGFWSGTPPVDYPAFYAYAYPEPSGFAGASVGPIGAFYSQDLREFILPYDVVRQANNPDAALLAFVQSTYEAAATLGRWDRAALEW
jgi:hypothetical protein